MSRLPKLCSDKTKQEQEQIQSKLLHQNSVPDSVQSQKHPNLIITYGPAGSGKSSVLQQALKRLKIQQDDYINMNIDNIVENSDEFKSRIQEIKQDLDRDPTTAQKKAAELYDAVRTCYGNDVYDELLVKAFRNHYHVVFETTGGSLDWFARVILFATKAGYRTVAVWPYVDDVNELKKRVTTRGKETGRFVPDQVVHSMYASAKKNFLCLATLVDELYIYDNSTIQRELVFELEKSKDLLEPPIVKCKTNLRKLQLYDSFADQFNRWCHF